MIIANIMWNKGPPPTPENKDLCLESKLFVIVFQSSCSPSQSPAHHGAFALPWRYTSAGGELVITFPICCVEWGVIFKLSHIRIVLIDFCLLYWKLYAVCSCGAPSLFHCLMDISSLFLLWTHTATVLRVICKMYARLLLRIYKIYE